MKIKTILLLILINIGLHATDMNKLKSNCKAGTAVDCSTLGLKYYKVKNMEKAYFYQKKACTLKNSNACFITASLYHVVAQDEVNMITYLRKACDLNHMVACVTLGSSYYTQGEEEKSIPYLKQACFSEYNKKIDRFLPPKETVQEVCNQLSSVYSDNNNVKGASKAAKIACSLTKETGVVEATTAGSFSFCDKVKFVTGKFKPKFIKKLTTNCNNLDESACIHLHQLYVNERGVASNSKAITKIMGNLCEMGSDLCGAYATSSSSSDSSSSYSSSSTSSSTSSYKEPTCRNEYYTTCAPGYYPCRQVQTTRRVCD